LNIVLSKAVPPMEDSIANLVVNNQFRLLYHILGIQDLKVILKNILKQMAFVISRIQKLKCVGF
jgi:hypothetical protein